MELLRQNPEWLLVGGLILITTFLFSRIARRRRTATPSVLTPHEQLERLRQVRGMRGDLEELMVEIEQMAKRMGAQLDAKAIRLEHLLEQAERRVEELRQLHASANPSAAPVSDDGAAAAAAANPTNPASTGRGLAAVYQASSGQPAATEAPVEEAPSPADLPDDPLARKVYSLADSGQSAAQIARHLEEHVGKIELILALRHA